MTQEAQLMSAQTGPIDESKAKPDTSRQQRTTQPVKHVTKSDRVIALLSRARGASIDEMMKATGWQAHSVRGFLSGTVRKKLGRAVISKANDKGRIYRITEETQ